MSRSITPEQQQEIQRLQQMSQQLNALHQNYLQMESSKRELDKTIKTLENIDDESLLYRSVGQILFQANAGKTKTDLKEQSELLTARVESAKAQLDSFEKQVKDKEAQIRSSIQ